MRVRKKGHNRLLLREIVKKALIRHWDSNPGPQPPLAAVGLLQSKALILDFQFD